VIAVALMYLAGKLSKFEVVDWQGRSSKHLRWWDMFVEDVTMDLLEGKSSQRHVRLIEGWNSRWKSSLYNRECFGRLSVTIRGCTPDICHQVLDLYSHPQNSQAPDSPPYRRSPPPVKKERLVPQPISPSQHSHSPIMPGNSTCIFGTRFPPACSSRESHMERGDHLFPRCALIRGMHESSNADWVTWQLTLLFL